MSENTTEVHEVLQQQAREIEALRLEIEALKRMMFEHRPAFIPAFHAARERVRSQVPIAECRLPKDEHPCG